MEILENMPVGGHNDDHGTNVGIAELTPHLSEYVKRAKAGEWLIICDRETPVAELNAVDEEREPLPIQRATRPWAEVVAELDAAWEANPVVVDGLDGVAMLREDRDQR